MTILQFSKELYPQIALLKASYHFTDRAYLHLDTDDTYYYVSIDMKDGCEEIAEKEFINEMLCQAIRHEVYTKTKNVRELILARAMASSVVLDHDYQEPLDLPADDFSENEILKDWFDRNG